MTPIVQSTRNVSKKYKLYSRYITCHRKPWRMKYDAVLFVDVDIPLLCHQNLHGK